MACQLNPDSSLLRTAIKKRSERDKNGHGWRTPYIYNEVLSAHGGNTDVAIANRDFSSEKHERKSSYLNSRDQQVNTTGLSQAVVNIRHRSVLQAITDTSMVKRLTTSGCISDSRHGCKAKWVQG
jgi:hypothetical protein